MQSDMIATLNPTDGEFVDLWGCMRCVQRFSPMVCKTGIDKL